MMTDRVPPNEAPDELLPYTVFLGAFNLIQHYYSKSKKGVVLCIVVYVALPVGGLSFGVVSSGEEGLDEACRFVVVRV